jgi:hypothetical protein
MKTDPAAFRLQFVQGLWLGRLETRFGPIELILEGTLEAPDPAQQAALEAFLPTAVATIERLRRKLACGFLYRPIRLAVNTQNRVGVQFRNRLTGNQSQLLFAEEPQPPRPPGSPDSLRRRKDRRANRRGRRPPQGIPSAEDFARAKARIDEQSAVFNAVRKGFLRRFAGRAPVRDIYLFPSPTTDYDAWIFYHSEADIEACRADGTEDLMVDAVTRLFAKARPDLLIGPTVSFQFDSHENVLRKCNGNYFQYLR